MSDILSLNMGEVVFIAAQLKSRFFFVPANCLLFYFHQFDGFCKYPLQLQLLWLPTGSLTLCMLGNFSSFFVVYGLLFSKSTFSKNSFSNVTISDKHFAGVLRYTVHSNGVLFLKRLSLQL